VGSLPDRGGERYLPLLFVNEWTVHPEAEALVDQALQALLHELPRLAAFADDLHRRTSTRLIDWIDHLSGPAGAGFEPTVDGLHRHPGAQLPALVDPAERRIMVRVDSAEAFGRVHGGEVAGDPGSAVRLVEAWTDDGVTFGAVERRSWRAGRTPGRVDPAAASEALRSWADRPRAFDAAAGTAAALHAAATMVDLVGHDLAASYAMAGERDHWQARNHAAQVQHARQDALGLGWGNQDHHTFRSSRPAFAGLLEVLSALGFEKRERFFAGAEAGWGAQVLEQPGAGIVIFADVDLEPEEVGVDFTRGLVPTDRLGTIGLWCALHGESLLAAGMHHLEGQFDHDALIADLAGLGIGHMPPFSTMPHLWQAFTEAEPWVVPRERLTPLVAAGHLTESEAERFATTGAPGSHLENLTRAGGFKGFNQHNVSATIASTDPRAYAPG
jgi:hypothetical protein